MSEPTTDRADRRTVLVREPLVLFLILGAAIYGAWLLLSPQDIRKLTIDRAAIRALETDQRDLLGRDLTDEEKEEILQGFIDDEVLMREALDRGLQLSDGRIRQRLTRIMRGALTETVADPSVAQLEAYFRDNIDRFTSPGTTTLEQVVWPWGGEVDDDRVAEVRTALLAGADPARYGQASMMMPTTLLRQSRADLVRAYGADFADRVEAAPAGEWQEPVESVRGVHLIRVLERHPPEVAEFEQIENYLRQEWTMNRMRELQQESIDEMRATYRIEIVD